MGDRKREESTDSNPCKRYAGTMELERAIMSRTVYEGCDGVCEQCTYPDCYMPDAICKLELPDADAIKAAFERYKRQIRKDNKIKKERENRCLV